MCLELTEIYIRYLSKHVTLVSFFIYKIEIIKPIFLELLWRLNVYLKQTEILIFPFKYE